MSIKIKFSDLNESEKDQIFDLLILKNMVPQIDYSNDEKDAHCLHVLVNESVAIDFQNLLMFILKHIKQN